ncbi:alkaline shock response membrane anchor protein AmaP [Christensenellaceae bacterium OttesenSCG-928-L17]|nr:alkaline shock response membrane anchor protein AmaP [Christensenellaceae bacterium OttesenSCG-928-L17]
MKVIDRIILVLLLIVVIAVALGLGLVATRIYSLETLQQLVASLYQNNVAIIVLAVVALVLLVMAIRLLFADAGGKKKKDDTVYSALVQAGELGSTFITISALDAMVQKHCRANAKVRNVESKIQTGDDEKPGIFIRLKLGIMPDVTIPELTNELQQSLKEYVEQNAGLHVNEISILVEDMAAAPQKNRVE